MVPLLAVGILASALVGVAIVITSGGGGSKVPAFDRTALVDDLKKYADDHPNDHDEVVARWEGLRDVVDGDLVAKVNDELAQVEQRFQTQARGAVDELDGKVTRALTGSPRDFDAALAAVAAFPARFRGSSDWQRRGATLENEVLKRRAAFEEGGALLKAARESWEKDHSADVLSGLYAAYPAEYRETEEGRAICTDFDALRNSAMDQVISSAGAAADAAAIARDELKYKKGLAERQKLEDSAPEPEHVELAATGFEWQIRDARDMNTGEEIRGAYKFSGSGKLTITNDHGEQPIMIGKNKRDWNNFTIEFKIKVKKGTQVWFLGRVWGRRGGGLDVSGYEYDKLALCNSATDADKKPHLFQGIPDDQWVRLKYRCLGGKGDVYDVVVDGKDVYHCRTQTSSGVTSGGFAFLVGKGQVEIEELKAKVVSRKWDAGGGSDDD